MKLLNLFSRPGETFAAKIFLVIILLIVILSVSFTGFFVYNQWKSRTELLIHQGESMAKLLAYTVRLGVFAENPELLKDPIEGVLQNKEVIRVSVFTLNGKPLKEEHRSDVKEDDRILVPNGKDAQEIFNRLKRTRNTLSVSRSADTLESWAPVISGSRYSDDEGLFFSDNLFQEREHPIGFVNVVLDKKILNDSLRRLLINSSLIALFSLAAAVFVVFFVVKGITKPLDRLTERVKMMGSGSPLEKVPVETEDEIGKLAAAFNAMADSLQSRDAEKGHLEQQLRQAHKMEAVGTLAGGVAHDFNNILSAIEGYALLLQERIKKRSPVRTYVDQIVAAADRASDLTRRLLAFSKNQIINPKPINVNETISNIKELLARLVGENIEFRISASKEELVVMADELQIEQTVINLVTNARDAMPHGGVLEISTDLAEVSELPIESHRQVRPGTYARIMVSDTGVGIDPSTRERIFDPFFSTKEVGKGTGLGLSMVYGIIKQHNGYVEVDSESGVRTTFSVYLPVVDSIVERKRLEAVLLPAGNRETVLLAEDDRFVRMLTKHILTKYGYHVIEAVDGDDALQKLRENLDSVQLLLLDVIMPKKNGRQIYDEAMKMKPDIRTVFMSGHTYDVISKEGVFPGEIPLISKPLTPGELLVKVREVLDGPPGNRIAG
jgi:signal transduction histidine kinase